MLPALWIGLGGLLAMLAAILATSGAAFDYSVRLRDIPAFWIAGGLALAGLLYLCVPWLVGRTIREPPARQRRLLAVMIAIGLGLRAMLLWSEPALEDDYHRYLWDGAVTAHGLDPYRHAPAAAAKLPESSLLYDLYEEAGARRVAYTGLRLRDGSPAPPSCFEEVRRAGAAAAASRAG